MSLPSKPLNLVADIGGTNTRVALADGVRLVEGSIRRYPNAGHASLEAVLRQYRAEHEGVTCAGACVAIAGPVREGVGTLTNLDWTMDEVTLSSATGAPISRVINDLQAQAYALGHLPEDQTPCVLTGHQAGPGAARLVIGVGTGFNAAPVHETATGRVVPPSECGHANLPVRTAEELDLIQWLEDRHGFPAVEDVLSGRGLERLYAWCSPDRDAPPPPAKDIVAALQAGDEVALAAAAVFVNTLGTVAGNLALIHLPLGGVYFAGGVARAMRPYFDRFGFAQAFRDKGRFAGFMEQFPAYLIEDDYAALKGCANVLDQSGA